MLYKIINIEIVSKWFAFRIKNKHFMKIMRCISILYRIVNFLEIKIQLYTNTKTKVNLQYIRTCEKH